MTNDIQEDKDTAPEAITAAEPARTPALRGFARMDPQRQREIAQQGGRAAHALGRAHEFTAEEARQARAKSRQNRSGTT